MYPHCIRLRGPWECEPLERIPATEPLPEPRRIVMPCRWRDSSLGEFAGRVRLRRRFGLPRTIDAHERLWITCAGVRDRAEFWLNGHHLGRHDRADEPCAFEVTTLLQARNELVAEVESASGEGGLWGETTLLIRCTAYLEGVRVRWGDDRLQISGIVRGTAERPLDLYVRAAESTVLYLSVQAGQPFAGSSTEPVEDNCQEVQLQLVDGGVVWDEVMVAVLASA